MAEKKTVGQIDRALWTIRALEDGCSVGVTQLIEFFGITKRMAYRDLGYVESHVLGAKREPRRGGYALYVPDTWRQGGRVGLIELGA